MTILFISLIGEIEPVRDFLKNERGYNIIEIPTDYTQYLEVFKTERPSVVFIRFLGQHSHYILAQLKQTRIPTRIVTYTYDYGLIRVTRFPTYQFDGYFHLQMSFASILKVFDNVMHGRTMLEYKESEL